MSEQFTRIDFSLPQGLFKTARPIERDGETFFEVEAKVFEEGDYSDKGVRADREFLEKILSNTPAQIPVGLLHRGTPWVRQRDGKPRAIAGNLRLAADALFATFELDEAAKDTLECADLKGVSVSLPRGGMPRISRIDPVEWPRVASARLFSQGENGEGATDQTTDLPTVQDLVEFAECLNPVEFDDLRRALQSKWDRNQTQTTSDGQKSVGGRPMTVPDNQGAGAPGGGAPAAQPPAGQGQADFSVEFAAMKADFAQLKSEKEQLATQLAAEAEARKQAEAAHFSERADRQTQTWLAEGRIVPDQQATVKALLLAGGEVQFGDGAKSVTELVREFVNSLPADRNKPKLGELNFSEPFGGLDAKEAQATVDAAVAQMGGVN